MARRRDISMDLADEGETLDARPRRRRPRRRWRLLLAVVAMAMLLLAAPAIVAKTGLRNLVLARALPHEAGRIACRDASFTWTGRQALAGVTVVDPAGAPIFGAEVIEWSRSIIGLVSNPADQGTLKLTRPVIQLDTREGGSNVEDLVQKIAEAVDNTADETDDVWHERSVEIQIVQGTIYGRDLASGQQWQIDALEAVAKRVPATDSWDITAAGVLTLAAGQRPAGAGQELAQSSSTPGRFKFHLHPAVAAGDPPARVEVNATPTQQQLELMADRVPLAPLEPWLARVLPAARVTGDASADLQVVWTPTAPGSAGGATATPLGAGPLGVAAPPPGGARGFQVAVAGKLNAVNLRFTSAALAGDLLELPTAAIAVDAVLADGRLAAKQLSARSEWLQAQVTGDFNLDELQNLTLRSLPTSDASITARAELPQLTRMLPRTLRLRPGVRVDAGSMEITARSTTAEGGRRWTVAASVQDLVGSDGVHPIQWSKPVEVAVDAADSPDGPQFERGLLRSAFANANVDGTPAGGFEGKLQFNLDELAAQLGQFVDLSAWKLQGAGQGEFSLRDVGDQRFAGNAELDLKQIDVQRDGKVVWRDPQLRVELQAAGSRAEFKPQRLETGTLTMRGPTDSLTVELLEPVDLGDFNRSWFVQLTGNGPLELWSGRLRPWVAAMPEQVAGKSTISAQVRLREGLVQVAQSKVSIESFEVKIGGRAITEPRVEAAGDFRWDKLAREFESQNLEMTSSTIAGRARGVSIQLSNNGPPTVRGDVALRGDLERIASWQDALSTSAEPRSILPRGLAVGRIMLHSDAQRATINVTLRSEPFQLVNIVDGSLAWNEPQLELATDAAYTHGDDRLQLSSVKLTGKTVQLAGGGAVEQLRTAGLVRGDLNVTYDAAEFAKLLAAYLGPGVQIQGANTAHLQASGRLFNVAPAAPPAAPTPAEGNVWNASTSPMESAATRAPQAAPLKPHWSRRWQITTDTGFSAANIYGLAVGAARLTASVRDGEVQFTPLDLTVGQGGRVNLQPRVLLDAQPQRLLMAPGPIVSNVAISAEVSERMLKYAAPILANATRAEGSFSFFLNNADIPLRQPKQGRLDGRLTIHQLAVTPGPMIQDVANLVRQIEAVGKSSSQGLGAGLGQGLLGLNILGGGEQPQAIKGVTMSERAIDVQVVDGRVYHRNLEFLIDDVPVRSSGSVGFDETLAITIEVPIQEKWVGSRPALKALVGQSLQIPVGGTFSRPQVDPRAIANFAAQAAQQAAGGVIGEEINKALDKILKPR